MTDPEDLDEDLFADLYEDDAPKAAAPTAAIPPIKQEAPPIQTLTPTDMVGMAHLGRTIAQRMLRSLMEQGSRKTERCSSEASIGKRLINH